MKTLPRFLSLIIVALHFCLTGCNSTRLESSWKAPEVGAIRFAKVLVIASAPTLAVRNQAEEAMMAQIKGVPVVASHQLLPRVEDLKDRAKLAALIKSEGIDGIIVMRAVSDDTEVSYQPGGLMPAPYRSFWGYYTRPYAMRPLYWEPGTITSDRVIGIETNIYHAKDEALIWSGLTKSTNPGKIELLVAEVAGVVRAKLREQQLIP